jgi:hypothetical protein
MGGASGPALMHLQYPQRPAEELALPDQVDHPARQSLRVRQSRARQDRGPPMFPGAAYRWVVG